MASPRSEPGLARRPRFRKPACPERLGPPSTLDPAQQQAADELVNGPRRGVYGPFRPLLHCPPLLRAVAGVGECLRYQGQPRSGAAGVDDLRGRPRAVERLRMGDAPVAG
jgi:hypothetical protein